VCVLELYLVCLRILKATCEPLMVLNTRLSKITDVCNVPYTRKFGPISLDLF
jgi:hypothetical protein